MKYHKQLYRHRPDESVFGDCYRTALACLLDKTPADVPHFMDPNGGGEHAAREWLREEHGLTIIEFATPCPLEELLSFMGERNPDGRYLLTGTSKSEVNHVVVCLGGKLEWDPSLDDTGIVGPAKGEDGERTFYWISVLTPC